jgi:putative alpha-1,2-mannosidase
MACASNPAEYASPFQKKKEKAEAGYYSVILERDRIKCELTATERVGVHRYTLSRKRRKMARFWWIYATAMRF